MHFPNTLSYSFLTETYLLNKFHHNFRSSPASRPPHPGSVPAREGVYWPPGWHLGRQCGKDAAWGRHLLVSLEPPQLGAGPPREAGKLAQSGRVPVGI